MQLSIDLNDQLPSNPRIFPGANNPPEDMSTARAARIILQAAEYLEFQFGDLLKKILAARKGKRPMSFRKVLCHALRGVVRLEDLAAVLDMNRKTVGEDQQRPLKWAEEDDAFDRELEHVSQAVNFHVITDKTLFEERLAHWTEQDVNLRKLEKQQKEHERAAREAEAAAEELEERAKVRAAKATKKLLRGVADASALEAAHMGAKAVAKRLSAQALSVLASLGRADDRGDRRTAGELNGPGLDECKKLGLARSAEPFLSEAPDPRQGITAFGKKVLEKAIELELVKPAKKRDKQPRD